VKQIGLADRLRQVGVPQHNIGIEADADRALASPPCNRRDWRRRHRPDTLWRNKSRRIMDWRKRLWAPVAAEGFQAHSARALRSYPISEAARSAAKHNVSGLPTESADQRSHNSHDLGKVGYPRPRRRHAPLGKPAHIGRVEIFLDLPVHTSCTRHPSTDWKT
jgi:hypothetical protein